MKRNVGPLICLFFLATSCGREPELFNESLAGYAIRFPVTSAQLRRQYPHAVESLLVRLTDTTTTSGTEAVWLFDESVSDPRSQPYGLEITLKNQGEKIDSIRSSFTKRYDQVFRPRLVPEQLGKDEYYEPDSTLSIMQVNRSVQLSLKRKKFWPTNGFYYTNDVIISFCYNLDDTQRERFAMKQGDIRVRD